MQKIQAGFSLPELMIVMTIIGVLGAIAIPIANQYTVRAKISEAILSFSSCKNQVVEAYTYADESPGAGYFGCESITPVSRYVASLKTDDNGIIIVELSDAFGDGRLNLQHITLAPQAAGGGLPAFGGGRIAYWRCGSPLDTSATGSPGTEVNVKFLPASCMGN